MDLTIKTEEGTLNCRTGAIIVHNNKLLMVDDTLPGAEDVHYFTVGGRIHMQEASDEAIIREVREELGIDMEIDYLALIEENFFFEPTHQNHFHEYGFYYLLKDTEKLDHIKMVFEDGGKEMRLKWVPLELVKDTPMYPPIFQEDFFPLDGKLRRIVSRE